MDNLELAPGRPTSLFLVLLPSNLELDNLEPASIKKIIWYLWSIHILIWGSTQKIRSLPQNGFMKSLLPLYLNWPFQASKVRGFFRHKFWSLMKSFQIFINAPLSIFKNVFTLYHIAMNTLYVLNSTFNLISVLYKTNGRNVFILLLFSPEFAGSDFVDNRILMWVDSWN